MKATAPQRIFVLGTHAGGEPTRLVRAGGPDLGRGLLTEGRERFRREFGGFRSAVVNEPRGPEVRVGALAGGPTEASCAAGVHFPQQRRRSWPARTRRHRSDGGTCDRGAPRQPLGPASPLQVCLYHAGRGDESSSITFSDFRTTTRK